MKVQAKFTSKLHSLVAGAALMLIATAALVWASPMPVSAETQVGSVGLSGTVPTDPPSTAPTISVPSNGQSFQANPITVSGLCETDLLVKIFKNGVFSGSTMCVNGSYNLQIDLFSGSNDLIARAFDALDQSSPDSNLVRVTLNDNIGNNALEGIIVLTSPYARRGANPNQDIVWPISISGGRAPYAISIEWGDGKTELMSISQAGEFSIKHAYESPGSYRIVIKATDSDGKTAYLQLIAIANGAIGGSAATGNTTEDDQSLTTSTKIKIVWVPAAVAIPMVLSTFWLGKKYQKKRFQKIIQSGGNPFI